MEGNDGLRTLECLRGRLLAERQASKVAKGEAELMGNKLLELEKKLKEETKLRKKAEKRLKSLMKKLESLNISYALEGSDQSSISENSVFSCTSSMTSSSGSKEDSQESESNSQSIIPSGSEDIEDNDKEEAVSTQGASDSCSVHKVQDIVEKTSHESNQSSTHSKPDDDEQSSSNLGASAVEMENNAKISQSDNDFCVDDTLALVPLSLPAEPTKTRELKIVNKSVIEVLDALRHAREQIQTSMERGSMISVGPT